MLIQASTSDKLQVITSAAGAVKVHASWIDYASGVQTPGRTNTASIATATTTDIVAAPAASTLRTTNLLSVRNTSASVTQTITVQHTDGTNVEELWIGTLAPGESVVMDRTGVWTAYANSGVIKSTAQTGFLFNQSTAAQGAGFATDTYVTGSNILIPSQRPRVGSTYRCLISMSKTAAGTATPIVQLRYGTAASTADTSLCSFTFSAGTAATDVGLFEVIATFRAIGSGTSAVVQGHCALTSQPTTGFSSLLHGVQTTSAGFDSTTSNAQLGVSVNGGTSAAWTAQLVQATLLNI
jgi:hypothetical protein